MAKRTIRQTLVDGLRARGWKPCNDTPSRKFLKFYHPTSFGEFLWVGKAGALRSGRTVSDSRPVSDAYRMVVIKAAEHTVWEPPVDGRARVLRNGKEIGSILRINPNPGLYQWTPNRRLCSAIRVPVNTIFADTLSQAKASVAFHLGTVSRLEA